MHSNHFCQTGSHNVPDLLVNKCMGCGRAFCPEHQGNPDVLAGFFVACNNPACVEKIGKANAEALENLRQIIAEKSTK